MPRILPMGPSVESITTTATRLLPPQVEYYSARAAAGLIITEATVVSEQGRGFPNTPGVYSAEQVEGWKAVCDAVHAAGGKIVCQLWHQGRTGVEALSGEQPVGPSADPFKNSFDPTQLISGHRAITLEEIPSIIATYAAATENARKAGFDGVEVHGANGYLPDQFLQDGSNKRTDSYGGSFENRSRFLKEVMEACIGVWSADRVGVRLSPPGHFGDVHDSDPKALFTHVVKMVASLNPAYVHLVEPRDWGFGASVGVDAELTGEYFKQFLSGVTLLSASGHDQASGEAYLAEGKADGIVYGRSFLSNPDLVQRFAAGPGAKLNAYHRDTFYADGDVAKGGREGYNDYPTLAEIEAQAPGKVYA